MSDKRWTYQVSEWSYDSATGAVGRGTLPLDGQTKADYTDMFMVLTETANGHEAVTTASFSHYKGLTDLLTEKDAGYADETLDLSALGGGVYLDIYKVTVMDNLSPYIKSGRAQYGLGDGDGEINAESLGANIATITGTGHDDFILGSERSEIISGGDGNDILEGGIGGDMLNGGTDADGDDIDTASYVNASATDLANDVGLVINLADDSQNTGEAAGDSYTSIERVVGSAYDDMITGDDNDNILEGGAGADTLDGGAGTDTASYADAEAGVIASLVDATNNTGDAEDDSYANIENLTGSVHNDTLTGDDAENVISGGAGDDFLFGGGSGDMLIGGDGNDILDGGAGGDELIGGDGTDTVNYSLATGGVTVSLADDTQNAGGAAGDSFTSIERVLGSSFNDIITGDGNNNFLVGNGGTDSLTGGGGADTFAFNLTGSDAGTATITDFALTDNDTIFIQTASGTDTTSLTTANLAIITDPSDSANAQLVDATDNATIYAIFEDITSAELLTANITLAAL